MASVYLPYEDQPPSQGLERLAEDARKGNWNLVIGCDSNAHSTAWGSADDNGRVRGNRKHMPKDLCNIKLKRGEYAIRSCNGILAIKWKDKRDVYIMTTKHETVEMTTQGFNRTPKPNCIREYNKGMNGIDLQDQILACFPVMRKYMKGYKKIFFYLFDIGLFNSYILCNKINNGKKQCYVDYRIKIAESLLENMPKPYYKERRQLSSGDMPERLHAKHWAHFPKHIDPTTSKLRPSKPCKVCQKNKKRKETTWACSGSSVYLQQDTNHEPTADDWISAEEICREDKIRWAINSFSPFKTPGLDRIIPALLQWGLEDLVPHLLEIFQACLALRYIPSRCREVTLNFIPKPGKLDYFTPKSFRPISLSSFLLKTLERLCDRYIRDFCLPTKPVNPNQHAYTQGKSTLTALHSVTSFVGGALDLKESALGVFIDIEGAFDKTTFSGISEALLEHNVPPTLCGWIENTLKHRIVKLRAGDVSLQGGVTRGCPQGGVLSPLLEPHPG
ncbi:uncharacterized protein [Onthophagus taurus]|uniref:uncharacterized protein n=1 Tax=Onthophagus taurus TaxID=166361 RepID=UPI0039BE891A